VKKKEKVKKDVAIGNPYNNPYTEVASVGNYLDQETEFSNELVNTDKPTSKTNKGKT